MLRKVSYSGGTIDLEAALSGNTWRRSLSFEMAQLVALRQMLSIHQSRMRLMRPVMETRSRSVLERHEEKLR